MTAQAYADRASPEPLDRLFSPFRLGRLTLKNRIVSPPHGTNFGSGGAVTDQQVAYYERRAKGGVALIVAGHFTAWPRTEATPQANAATDPAAGDGHRRIADAVHRHGAFISAQLHFGGRQGGPPMNRRPMLAPSPIPDPQVRVIPKEFEPDEIDAMVKSFGLAAARMRSAGWDGVEVLAAQGYGLAQFLSPQTNRRSDQYGGGLRARMRILLDVVAEIRKQAGSDLLLGVRMNGDDCIQGGLTVDDAREIAVTIEQTEMVDYLSISGASNENHPLWIADMSQPRGLFVPLAQEIRKGVTLPLLVATRITDPAYAESVLALGGVDLVGMTRALIADPDLPVKAQAGALLDIRPCIGCNQGCIGSIAVGSAMRCTVNPEVGREAGLRLVANSTSPRDVLVIGGGPAGLQASVTAATAGNRVVLYEERQFLGGQARLASRTQSRADMALILDHLELQARELGVDVRVGETFTIDALERDRYDVVLLATGSVPARTGFTSQRPSVLAIPGVDSANVMTAWDLLEAGRAAGQRVLVLDDDPHGQAVNVADNLATSGRQVTLVCRAPNVGFANGPANQQPIYRRLFGLGVRILEHTWVDRIAGARVECSNIYSGAPVEIGETDSVVLAAGNVVRDELYQLIRSAHPEQAVARIGDCLAPRRLDDAIWDGYEAGRRLDGVLERE